MPDLIAIAYDDTTTAVSAMDEAQHLAQDLVLKPDAIAAIDISRSNRTAM